MHAAPKCFIFVYFYGPPHPALPIQVWLQSPHVHNGSLSQRPSHAPPHLCDDILCCVGTWSPPGFLVTKNFNFPRFCMGKVEILNCEVTKKPGGDQVSLVLVADLCRKSSRHPTTLEEDMYLIQIANPLHKRPKKDSSAPDTLVSSLNEQDEIDPFQVGWSQVIFGHHYQ
jgi:hypothetical protein